MSSARTVLHVLQPVRDGVPSVVRALAADQAARGWDVIVAAPEDVGAVGTFTAWPASREPGPGTPGETRRLRKVVRHVAPDAVHLHSAKAGLAGRLALRGTVPTLYQPHAWSFLAARGPLRAAATTWERFATRWTSAIVCCSEGERELGLRAGVKGPTAVVHNGVDLERFRPGSSQDRAQARRTLGLPDGPLAVCVGRLSRQKGQDVLVEAWEAVATAVPGSHLAIVGDGPECGRLSAQAGGGVLFPGRTEDVLPWLHAADVVAVPSRYEGLALALLEAMAAARSVVASDVPGTAEALGPDSGAVVPVEDAGALAGALVARLVDGGLAEAEGAAGRRRAEERFSLAASTAAMAELTSGLITGAGRARR